MRFGARGGNQFDGASIETGEYRSAKPSSFERDDTIGEISAGFEDCESRIDSWPVELNISATGQISDRSGDVPSAATVPTQQHPDEFTQHRQWHNDEFGALQ